MVPFARGLASLCGSLTIVAALAAPAGASGIVPPRQPSANLTAQPAFNIVANQMYSTNSTLPPCWKWHDGQLVINPQTPACTAAEVAAINRAHRLEHIAPIVLPRNFSVLNANEQSLVLVDLERVSRGEVPVVGLSAAADAIAQGAAKHNQDPYLASAHAVPGATGSWTANWAAAANTLDADYSWMYLDGWAGKGHTTNFACTSAHAQGCWGHRNDILVNASTMKCYVSQCNLIMGAGVVAHNWSIYNSYTELLVQVAGPPPHLVYTWRQAVAAGARA